MSKSIFAAGILSLVLGFFATAALPQEGPKSGQESLQMLAVTPPGPQGQKVVLFENTGPCVAGAKLAHYIEGNNVVPGCWTAQPGGIIQIAYFDSDTGAIPAVLFQKPEKT